MRHLALAALVLGSAFAAAPALAQTYGPGYPVCLHVFGRGTYYECGYNSIAQCNMTASGRAAQCVLNPYAANAGIDQPPLYHRHPRRVY